MRILRADSCFLCIIVARLFLSVGATSPTVPLPPARVGYPRAWDACAFVALPTEAGAVGHRHGARLNDPWRRARGVALRTVVASLCEDADVPRCCGALHGGGEARTPAGGALPSHTLQQTIDGRLLIFLARSVSSRRRARTFARTAHGEQANAIAENRLPARVRPRGCGPRPRRAAVARTTGHGDA